MTKKSKIAPVPTVFLLRQYQSTKHQNIVPPKEHCRHRCNFRYILLLLVPSSYTEHSFINQEPKFQDRCLMGYRCAPGVTIFNKQILDTFLKPSKFVWSITKEM